MIHQVLSGPELKLGLDKKNQPMLCPKNLFCANKVSRMYTHLNFKFENTYKYLLYIFTWLAVDKNYHNVQETFGGT